MSIYSTGVVIYNTIDLRIFVGSSPHGWWYLVLQPSAVFPFPNRNLQKYNTPTGSARTINTTATAPILSSCLYFQTVLTSCDNQHWSVSDNFAANILLWVVVRIHQGLWSQPIQCCCQNILIWSNFYWREINTPLLVVNMLWFQYPVPNWMILSFEIYISQLHHVWTYWLRDI